MRLTEAPSPPLNPSYALVLPLLVAVTTYIQFKFTQAQSGAAQQSNDGEKPNQAQAMSQSMGTIMPIMFGFISLSLSVGLSIYFITSNLVGIAQYSPSGKRILDRIFGGGKDNKEKDGEDAKTKDDEPSKPRKKGMST
jgi:YidC/Oxa1 family membrane protein insertase